MQAHHFKKTIFPHKINYLKICQNRYKTKIFVHWIGCYFIFFTFEDELKLYSKGRRRSTPCNWKPTVETCYSSSKQFPFKTLKKIFKRITTGKTEVEKRIKGKETQREDATNESKFHCSYTEKTSSSMASCYRLQYWIWVGKFSDSFLTILDKTSKVSCFQPMLNMPWQNQQKYKNPISIMQAQVPPKMPKKMGVTIIKLPNLSQEHERKILIDSFFFFQPSLNFLIFQLRTKNGKLTALIIDKNLFMINYRSSLYFFSNFIIMEKLNRPLLSIAPMVDVSNTHFRYFTRLITKQAAIYTQMLHHNAVANYHQGILPFHPKQHPIVLQLGGCDPEKLADAAQIGVKYGYDEINLNVGCPSPRVQSGSFGACLMKQPKLVFDCMKAMKERVKGTSCTVKCRLGVDEFDSYQFARDFIEEVSKQNTVDHFIIHARKAYLKGLNPSQNRNVPPLWYDRVYKLQQDFPHLKFSINGGIKTIQHAKSIIDEHKVWGVMIGRAAYENPYQLVHADQMLYGHPPGPLISREEILLKYADYLDNVQNLGYFNEVGPTGEEDRDWLNSIKHHYVNPVCLIKPVINLFHGQKGSVKFRQFLSDPQRLKSEPLSDVIKTALELMKPKGHIHQNHRDTMEEP